jgi:MFS family permease
MSVLEKTQHEILANPATTRHRWHLPPIVAFVGVALAFVGVSFAAGAPSPLFVRFQQEWGFPAWVLTVAFAIYAVTLLATLLVAGSLSDHIGRRPVLIGALVVEIAAMVAFIFAPNIGWIIVARAIQGVATGALTATFTAAIVELAPERHKRMGALIGSTAPVGGLALGALATGFALQFASQPSVVIFSFLVIVFILGVLVVAFSRETVEFTREAVDPPGGTVARRRGTLWSLVPRLSVPAAARREFSASIPVLVATWMVAGLFLGLAPSIARGFFHIDSGLISGILVALQPAAGTASGLLFGRVRSRTTTMIGASAVFVGVAIVVIAVLTGTFPLLFVGGAIGGAGFGAAFSGIVRTMAPLAAQHQRAELFSAIYLVCYLAYGVPALVAGELIGIVGLPGTVVGYGAVVMVLAAVGLAVQLRRATTQPPTQPTAQPTT